MRRLRLVIALLAVYAALLIAVSALGDRVRGDPVTPTEPAAPARD